MKNFFLKTGLTLLCLIIGLGSAWGEDYQIVFKTATSDGSTEIKSSTASTTVIASGAGYVSGFTGNCSKAYYNGKSGVKIGSGSAAGTLEMNIANAYQSNISKITMASAQFGTDTGKLTIYNGSTVIGSDITPGDNFSYTFDNPTTVSSIKIVTSSKRAYVTSITLTAGAAEKHNVSFYENGEQIGSTIEVEKGSPIEFPEVTSPRNGKVFVGWTTSPILVPADIEPSTLVTSANMGTSDVTYYAVYATQTTGGDPVETKSQTLQYDTWTYSGSTTDKSSYRLFHSGSYIESAPFDLSKLSKVVVYGGTFGGTSYNSLTIGDGTNTWKSVTVSGSSQTGKNEYTEGKALSGTKSLRITSNSGTATGTGVRISKVEIYTLEGGTTYSGYCTIVDTSTPSISADDVNIAADATSGEIEYSITNAVTGKSLSANTTAEWISNIQVTADKVTFTTSANTATTERTAEITLTYDGATDKVVTVTQTGKQGDQPIPDFIKTRILELVVGAEPYDISECLNIPNDYNTSTYAITTTINDLTEKDGEYACVYPYISFQKAGTYTVHVVAAAIEGKYAETSGDITVNVTNPTGTATFTFNSTTGLEELGINEPASGAGTNLAEYYYNGAILMRSTTTNSIANREWKSGDALDFRVYNGGTLTFSGATITKIEITGKNLGKMTAASGEISVDNVTGTATWQGSLSSVELNATEQTANIKTITVYYDPSSVPATYKVIYDGNGCGEAVTGTPTDNNDYTENASVTVSDVPPTREGYTFTGWNTKGNASTSGSALSANGTFSITANTVIYAQWTINSYTLTKGTAQNGSFTMKNGEVEITDNATIEYKTTIKLSATPENGYKFVRYDIEYGEDQSFTKETAEASITMPAGDATVTAVFESLPTCAINWSVNGSIVKTENLLEGTAVTAPTDDEIAAEVPEGVTKVFTGWVTTSTVDADNAPTYVNVTTATATEAITYYAVFATESGSGSGSGSVTEELTSNEIENLGSLAYGTDKKYTDGTIDYLIHAYKDTAARPWAQLKKDTGSYIKIMAPSAITNVTITITSGQNSSGGINDITKHTAFSGKVGLTTSDCNFTTSSENVASATETIQNNTAVLEPTGTNTELYLKVSTGARIWDISVTYGGGTGTTYSDFTTQLFLTTITVSKYGSTTLSLDKDYTMPEGLTGKIITAKKHKENEGDGYYTLTYVTKYNAGDVVPAGEALVIQDGLTLDESRDYRVYEGTATGEVTSYPDNLLCAEYTEDASGKWLTSFNNGVDNYYYKLTTKNGANFGWYWGDGGNRFLMTSKERAYLVIDKETASAVRGFALADGVEEDITTFIESLTNDELIGNGRIYNLQGLRQNTLQKGINIVNGKKVIR